MCAAGPEGGGGAGSAAVATAGEPVAGLGLTLQTAQPRRPPTPIPQLLWPKKCVLFRTSELKRTSEIL